MVHDPTKVLLGQVPNSEKEIEVFESDPTTYIAGLAVRRDDAGALSVTKADGSWVGVSVGKSLSNIKKTGVCRAGLRVPVLLEAGPARLVIEITSYANLVAVSDDTLQIDDGTADVTLTFKASASTEDEVAAATDNATTAAALVTKINAHSVLGPLYKATRVGAVVTVTRKDNAIDGADIDVTYTANASIGLTLDDTTFTGGDAEAADYITKGANVYFSDVTGKADDPNSESTVSNAIYASGILTGIDESGNEVSVALVDMIGGL